MLAPYPADRLHNQHPPPPAQNQSGQPNRTRLGGQFWTPIPRLRGSKLHAETQPEERTIEIESGKALVVRLTTLGDTDEEGQVRVFFELNGQPRVIKVPNRSAVATRPARRKAEEGNANHVCGSDARFDLFHRGQARPRREDWRYLAIDRGHENGDHDLRTARWNGAGVAYRAGAAGQRKGFAGRNRLVVSRTRSSTAPRGPNWAARTRFSGT